MTLLGFLLLLLKAPKLKIEAKEKIQNKVDKGEQDEFLKALIWACAGFDGFTEINKINSKMIAHFGKDWGMKKPLLKAWRGFLSYIQLFLIFATKIKKHTERATKRKHSF